MFGWHQLPHELRRFFIVLIIYPAVWCVSVFAAAVVFFDAPSVLDPGPHDWDLFWQPFIFVALGPSIVAVCLVPIAWALYFVFHKLIN